MFYLYHKIIMEDMSSMRSAANTSVLGRIIAPKYVYIFIPELCEYGTLHSKSHLAGVIKLRLLRWRDYLRLSAWAQWYHRGLSKTESGGLEAEKKM